jgi:spore coat polysaccharide biosynthesis predicted glycosyltransferase SpsG
MGHLARCRALATWLDHDVTFVVAADDDTRRVLATQTRCLPSDLPAKQEVDWWRDEGIVADTIIFDLSCPPRVSNRTATKDLVTRLGARSGMERILIDGIGSQVLVDGDGWPLDAIVVPTAGGRVYARDVETLTGATYFILPRSWGPPPQRDPARPIRRVLVTMGGSDPYGLTLRVLDALAECPSDWTIAVVIGPAFDKAVAETLRARVAADRHLTVLEAPAELAPHLIVADLAIAATGLTKYEAAWAGLPSIQISIDRLHAELNEAFAAEKTAIHLGAADDVTNEVIATAIFELARDPDRRADMSLRGQKLIDGQGGARIADRIRTRLDA